MNNIMREHEVLPEEMLKALWNILEPQISLCFYLLGLVKSLSFYILEAHKSYPFLTEPFQIG